MLSCKNMVSCKNIHQTIKVIVLIDTRLIIVISFKLPEVVFFFVLFDILKNYYVYYY